MERWALITGGTKGIGKAVGELLAQSGYNLILTYANDETAARKIQEQLHMQYPVTTHILKADITTIATVNVVDAFLAQQQITLNALILNAGITNRDPFEDIRPEDWEKVFFANVHFPVFLLQKIITRLQTGASVTFTGSLMGIQPHSVSLAYGVTKSAVHALVKNLVKFLAPYQVRVNGVAPGFVDTEWQKTKPAEIRRNIENKVALQRFCLPEEVVGVYKMLIENNYMNGEIVVIDGAYSYK